MRTKILGLAGVAVGLALAFSAPASAEPVNIPIASPSCGYGPTNNCLVFDNFTIFSLALLNFQAGAGDVNGNDPYAVSTNGTDLRNALVIGTGPAGAQDNTDVLPTGADNAYATPNTAPGSPLTNFATSPVNANVENSTPPTPGIGIPSNSSTTWDVTTDALKTYLNGGSLVFFFNLNQTNSGQTSYLTSPEDALAWMAVTLSGPSGSITYYLDGDACQGSIALNTPTCDPGQAWGDGIGETNTNNDILTDQNQNHDDWAYVHGQICVADSGPLFGQVLQNGACTGPGKTVDQNLGSGLAAFALYSQALQDALLLTDAFNNPLYTKMSVDFRGAALDNGFEQLLIYPGNAVPQAVPEPLTITLFGAGLLGIALRRRRRSSR